MRWYVAHKIQVSMAKVKISVEGHRFITYKSCVSHNSKTNIGNLIKFHRKVKQNKKMCRT